MEGFDRTIAGPQSWHRVRPSILVKGIRAGRPSPAPIENNAWAKQSRGATGLSYIQFDQKGEHHVIERLCHLSGLFINDNLFIGCRPH
jgi:hypothetical protein